MGLQRADSPQPKISLTRTHHKAAPTDAKAMRILRYSGIHLSRAGIRLAIWKRAYFGSENLMSGTRRTAGRPCGLDERSPRLPLQNREFGTPSKKGDSTFDAGRQDTDSEPQQSDCKPPGILGAGSGKLTQHPVRSELLDASKRLSFSPGTLTNGLLSREQHCWPYQILLRTPRPRPTPTSVLPDFRLHSILISCPRKSSLTRSSPFSIPSGWL